MAINAGKVVVGGLAGGVVLGILDYLFNGVVMAEQNRAAIEALNPALAESMESAGTMVAFIVIDLLLGVLLVWTYAAMRPRFGPGPKTAVFAGTQVWLVALLLYASMTAMGMWTWGYLMTGAVAGLVMMIVAAMVGAKLYTEA